jgi:hypothetical protein
MIEPKSMSARSIVLWLLLICGGAIVNIAVAWGCGILVPVGSVPQLNGGDGVEGFGAGPTGREHWHVQRNESWGVTRLASIYVVDFISRDASIEGVAADSLVPAWANNAIDRGSETQRLLLYAMGWPLRTLRCHYEVIDASTVELREGVELRGSLFPPNASLPRVSALPLRPIPAGFAINTIFYAAVLWVLFAIPGVVKRHRRRSRGQCTFCGYDLRGQLPGAEAGVSNKCPECGCMIHRS